MLIKSTWRKLSPEDPELPKVGWIILAMIMGNELLDIRQVQVSEKGIHMMGTLTPWEDIDAEDTYWTVHGKFEVVEENAS